MMARVKRALLATLVLAGLLVPAALADSGDPRKKFTTAGQARARAVALVRADFPAGWTSKPSNKRDQSQPRCSTYNPDQSDLVEIGNYDSPDFSRADGTFVSSSTSVFRTAAMARTGYSRVAVPQLPHCFAEIFKKGIEAPNSVTIFSSAPLPFAKYGDRSNAYRVTSSVKTPAGRVRATIDIVILNRGQVDIAVIFLGINEALPQAFEQGLVAKLAARAA